MRVAPKHDAYVLVNTQNGISVQQHRSSVCRVYSQPLTIRDSKLRLERVRGFPRSLDSTSAVTFGVSPGDSPEPFFRVEDPAALLLRSKDLIWLAVVEIYGIKQGGISLARLLTKLWASPIFKSPSEPPVLHSEPPRMTTETGNGLARLRRQP